MKIAFFEIRPGNKEFLEQALAGHQFYFSDQAVDAGTFPQTLLDVEVLSTHTQSKIDQNLIEKLPNLKLIATRTTGYDHIDLHTAQLKNIMVCNIPSYGENTVAEFAFALILIISRKIPQALDRVKRDRKFDFSALQGFDLKGKKIGVIGTGHIGAHAIQIAKGFLMEILAFDAYPNKQLEEQLQFKYVPLDKLLAESDIITLHVPYLPATHHLLNKDNFPKIKRGAVLINTSRGAVVESEALVQALKDGTLSAAGLDVLEDEEQLKKDIQDPNSQSLNMELIKMDNVYITPHTAFNTAEAESRILETTVENIKSFVSGTPQNLVHAK